MTKPRGRPRVDDGDTSVGVNVTLPAKQYDAYCDEARRAAVSVPEIIRRELEKKISESK